MPKWSRTVEGEIITRIRQHKGDDGIIRHYEFTVVGGETFLVDLDYLHSLYFPKNRSPSVGDLLLNRKTLQHIKRPLLEHEFWVPDERDALSNQKPNIVCRFFRAWRRLGLRVRTFCNTPVF